MSDNQEENNQIVKNLQSIVLMIEAAELNLKKAKQHLSTLTSLGDTIGDLGSIVQEIRKNNRKEENDIEKDANGQVIYGEFDGYFMLGDDTKKYPVPLNYSSKSKLVPGDKLKLTITDSGTLIYKIISSCDRKHIRAVLSKDDTDTMKYIAITGEGATYSLNQAAVTFFKGHIGDEMYITVNTAHPSNYVAIEAIIKS